MAIYCNAWLGTHRSVQDMCAPDLKFAGSSGEDLERQLQLLVLDDDNYGTRYLSDCYMRLCCLLIPIKIMQ